MSGTSLDGLDIAYCEFEKHKKWNYRITIAETLPYSNLWRGKLSSAFTKSTKEIARLDIEYGTFIGKKITEFIKKNKLKPDFVSSHGHTVFHQPERKLTLQIGNGKRIADACRLPVVYDFRTGDVALGGQGAPLVPVADKFLFSQYAFCLNLGGIANISFDNSSGERIAYDICPANLVFNTLSNELGKTFDKNGKIASRGMVNTKLLSDLNALDFYKMDPPKSLGREWIEQKFFPVLNASPIAMHDKMRTAAEHFVIQIVQEVNSRLSASGCRMLVTGGGAYNKFFLKRLSKHTNCKVVLPDDIIIQFKEAMAFAFLGVLRIRNEINVLKSVTGARCDSSAGKIAMPG